MPSAYEIFNILSKLRTSMICAGLVGNVISYVVFSRKTFRKNSINIYCRSMVVFASIYIIVQLIDDFASFAQVQLYTPSYVLCKLCFYVYITMAPITGWILAFFSIDKAASVLNIGERWKKLAFIRDRRFPSIAILTIVLANLLIYVIVPIYLSPVRVDTLVSNTTNQTQTSYTCNINTVSIVRVFNYLFLIESSLMPFSVMISATVIISNTLYSSRSKLFGGPNEMSKNGGKNSRRMRDRKFAITSIVFNVCYVLFQLPITLSYLIEMPDILTYYYFYVSSVLALNMHFSMPFVVFFITNSIFRREFLRLLGVRTSQLGSKYTCKSQAVTNTKDA